MRKKERQLVTFGLIVLFGVIAYWAYSGFSVGGFVDLNNSLNSNETTATETYTLGISNLVATVLDVGDVKISFSIANADKFNITSVKLYYALNVADPANASYTAVSLTDVNGTYEYTVDTKFGDVLYYYIEIQYVEDGTTKVFRYPSTGYESVTVTDTVAPTATLTIEYNATTGNATILINASDNDAIDKVILFYAITADGNLTNVTFSNVTLTVSPYTYTLTVDSNTTDTIYPYLDVYAEVYDISGNMARVPANGTIQLYANETKTVSG
ncbi:hypothetical protein [Pyrococcus yayanosii]|uniref:Uncharacterized protein n=1 Tax=Pyrococcus yayanosii (strain CH1 / JCM 16557) TaxID=529709 RepID=F8AG38_PYRYC|nr:hypothetical protein [Pyrococcus yayanosii]AEH25092.1 hypothetical protein PYCH_14220 [Pyrococcus yayanosii CH1]